MINAGRVAIVPKGEYNATTQYTKLDFIQYNGSCYVGLADNIPIGTLPTDTNYFQLCIDMGDYALKSNAVFENSVSMGRKADTEVGNYSVALGYRCEASGTCSYAEGRVTTANGNGSHAEGIGTISSGNGSHTEGEGTQARGTNSHAEGAFTIASSDNQTVIGKYNIEDTEGKYAFIIGNGTSTYARSNALAIKWDGTIVTSNF